MKRPKWREIVRRLVPHARLARGASQNALAGAESALSVPLPSDLRSLLGTTNGVVAGDGTRLVWSVAELTSQNRAFRDRAQPLAELYAPFDHLLLFGEEGNGDVFGYQIAGPHPAVPAVVKWDHETDERTVFARDLEKYLRLRAEAARADDFMVSRSPDRVARQVVSVWVSRHRSQAGFVSYLAAGGSGRLSKDGLPLSNFQADYDLSMKDVLKTEQHAIYQRRPTELRRLLEGIHGGEPLVASVVRRATATGRARAQAAILVYGLRYELRAAAEPRDVRYVGWFDFD